MYSKTYKERKANGICVDCGGEVVPGFIRCEKCLEKKREQNAEYRQKKQNKQKRSANLQEVMRAADAEGLSYGQYVAKYSKASEWRIKR